MQKAKSAPKDSAKTAKKTPVKRAVKPKKQTSSANISVDGIQKTDNKVKPDPVLKKKEEQNSGIQQQTTIEPPKKELAQASPESQPQAAAADSALKINVRVSKKEEKAPNDYIDEMENAIKQGQNAIPAGRVKLKIVDEDSNTVKEGQTVAAQPAPVPVPAPIAPAAEAAPQQPETPQAAATTAAAPADTASGAKEAVLYEITNQTVAAVLDVKTETAQTAPVAAPASSAIPAASPVKAVVDLSSALDSKFSDKLQSIIPDKKEPATEPPKPKNPHLNLYKRIAVIFAILAVLILGILFYTSFTSVKIVIVANQEKINNNVILDVYGEKNPQQSSTNNPSLKGSVGSINVTDNKSYPATGSKAVNADVTGKVILYNNYTKNQPLVASTRLLSPEGKLFRIKSTVNVPAGGSVEVEVYADKPGPDMVLEPTRFTIPGLWAGLQKQIFGESKEKMQSDSQSKHSVTQEDIDSAVKNIREGIMEKAKSDIEASQKDFDKVLFIIDEASLSTKVDAEAGEEKESFSVAIDAPVKYAAFKNAEALELIKQKYKASMPSDKELVSLDGATASFSINTCNTAEEAASITASFEGKVVSRLGDKLVDKKRVTSKSNKQIEDYLRSQPDIISYTITYSPSFIRRAPSLSDRIHVETK